MDALVIAKLIAQYGIPLAAQLWTWYKTGQTIGEAEWQVIEALSQYRSADALKAAGITIADGKVVKAA